MPLFAEVSNGFGKLPKAQTMHHREVTDLLSMFADDEKVKTKGREERCFGLGARRREDAQLKLFPPSTNYPLCLKRKPS